MKLQEAKEFLEDQEGYNVECILDDEDLKLAVISLLHEYAQYCAQEALNWRLFDIELPPVDTDILITWPSGNYPAEKRRFTRRCLKVDWSGMRWFPIPEVKPLEYDLKDKS